MIMYWKSNPFFIFLLSLKVTGSLVPPGRDAWVYQHQFHMLSQRSCPFACIYAFFFFVLPRMKTGVRSLRIKIACTNTGVRPQRANNIKLKD